MNNPETLNPPEGPGQWTLAEVVAALSRPLPDSMLQTKRHGGADLKFIPWHTATRVLNKYAPGWSWQLTQLQTTDRRIFVVGQLSITTADGIVTRQATGTEELYKVDSKTGEVKEIAYGDPSSNAESMAFRRAAAKFGLALYLYQK